jgi:histidyl-tRNA synthetase
MTVAAALRRRGIAVEVAPVAAKFGKQIMFAQRRGIPFVWFMAGEDRSSSPGTDQGNNPGNNPGRDSVKDIRSGEQTMADASVWTPPAEDLRPRVMA